MIYILHFLYINPALDNGWMPVDQENDAYISNIYKGLDRVAQTSVFSSPGNQIYFANILDVVGTYLRLFF